MNLHIRDPRALELAQKLADQKGVSVEEAVVSALEAQLEEPARDKDRRDLPQRLRSIADDLARSAGPNGRDPTKDEIDRMWGHE